MADILLIHGSCHGAWCWRDAIPALTALDHNARAIDLPGSGDDKTPVDQVTMEAYAETIAAACGPQSVLLGHSIGGYLITAAAEKAPQNIARLIYLCAYVPESGVTLSQIRQRGPRLPMMNTARMSEDRKSFSVKQDCIRDLFYHDCPEEAVELATKRLCPQAVAPFETALSLTDASQSLPKRYIRCMDDRTIPPEHQVTMTQDWPAAHVQELACGHSPFFADPVGLAHAIDRAIRS